MELCHCVEVLANILYGILHIRFKESIVSCQDPLLLDVLYANIGNMHSRDVLGIDLILAYIQSYKPWISRVLYSSTTYFLYTIYIHVGIPSILKSVALNIMCIYPQPHQSWMYMGFFFFFFFLVIKTWLDHPCSVFYPSVRVDSSAVGALGDTTAGQFYSLSVLCCKLASWVLTHIIQQSHHFVNMVLTPLVSKKMTAHIYNPQISLSDKGKSYIG